MAEQRQNNVELTDEEKEQRAKKRNRTIVTVVSVAAAVLIVVIVLLLLLVKCEPEENVDPPVGHTHTYSSWVVVDEPTCTEEGLRERTCSCGEKETEEIAALGHTAGEAVRENEKAPTCTEKGSYEEVVSYPVCEEQVSRKTVEVAALGHTEGEAEKENEVAATCLSAGSYEDVICCAVCGEELSRKTVEVAALGHDYKGVVTDEALCLVPGEMTYTCTRCDDSYTEEIAPLRHNWGETKPGQAPTCTAAGYTSYETCTRCGYSNRETIPALQHDWSEWTVTTPAECEKDGEQTRTCSRCQETEKQTIAALDHAWGDWEVTTEATCTEAGEQTHICSVCGDKETEAIAVDPTAHKPDTTDYITNQNEHWYTCLLCGGKASVAEHDYTGNVQNCTICGVTDSKYFNFTQLDDGTYSTTLNYNDLPTGDIVIPSYHEGKQITTLPNGSFSGYAALYVYQVDWNITSIKISEGITTIADMAFSYTNNIKVYIPESVVLIDFQAFSGVTGEIIFESLENWHVQKCELEPGSSENIITPVGSLIPLDDLTPDNALAYLSSTYTSYRWTKQTD